MPLNRIKPVIFLFVCACAVFLLAAGIKSIFFSAPNIVLISVDALRADHLGCYGYKRQTSPAIDALSREGVIFLNAFSHIPMTTASHMSMLTSLYPDTHGVMQVKDNGPVARLSPSFSTLAQILKSHGYATVGFTGGGNLTFVYGFGRGFDVYEQGGMNRFFSWLDANPGKRFFFFFHTYAVHDPYLPFRPFNRLYAPGYSGKIADSVAQLRSTADPEDADMMHKVFWSAVDTSKTEDVDFLIAQYDACINSVDAMIIDPLVTRLKERGLFKNTLIVLTADHGEAFKEHGNFIHRDLYRGTLNVPLLMVYPRKLPAGRTISSSVRIIDIMPTILELAGIRNRKPMQGRSLVPFIKGKAEDLACYSSLGTAKSLRKGRFCLMLPEGGVNDLVKPQLFDTFDDPGERKDIAITMPGIVAIMRNELNGIISECRRLSALCPALPPENLPPQDQKTLKSLGYLQ